MPLPPTNLPNKQSLAKGMGANMSTIEEWIVPADAKISWPEVVGLSSEAKKKIMEDKPDASVDIIVLAGFVVVTMDYCSNRVRVFVDSSDKVIKCPAIG
ncbi:hypothetical protein ACQ4PT_033474 [Festuca glaucescens]